MKDIVYCSECKYFDTYNVECEKNHNPKPPYNKWFCAEGKEKGLNQNVGKQPKPYE